MKMFLIESFGTDGTLNVQTAPLNEACMVLDIIGQDVRNQMIDWYCDKQLNDYKRKFQGIEEASFIIIIIIILIETKFLIIITIH